MNNIINAVFQPDGSVNTCVLVTIIAHKGSSPRSSGSRMVVYSDGSIRGTIGGGKLEAEAIESAVSCLVNASRRRQAHWSLEFRFSGTDAASMDMICGGEVTLLFEYIDPLDDRKKEILTQIRELYERKETGWFVLEYNPVENRVEWGLLINNGSWGKIDLEIDLIRRVQTFQSSMIYGSIFNIVRLDQGGAVLIFGAGHVGQSIARLCSMVGFKTTVIDDRAEYANEIRFPEVDQIIVPANIKEVFSELKIDKSAYIVIVTRGHLQDQVVIEWALKTNAGYVGMIGSRRKWRMIQESLGQLGFTRDDIARIHTPIGVEIGAETPEEIGISIVAELIQWRAQKKKVVEPPFV